MKLGTAIATVATPIARALNLPCIDPQTNDLRPESGCAQRKQWLNNVFSPNTGEQMKVRVTVTYQIEDATGIMDALEKAFSGKYEPTNISPQIMPDRPAPTPRPAQPPVSTTAVAAQAVPDNQA